MSVCVWWSCLVLCVCVCCVSFLNFLCVCKVCCCESCDCMTIAECWVLWDVKVIHAMIPVPQGVDDWLVVCTIIYPMIVQAILWWLGEYVHVHVFCMCVVVLMIGCSSTYRYAPPHMQSQTHVLDHIHQVITVLGFRVRVRAIPDRAPPPVSKHVPLDWTMSSARS